MEAAMEYESLSLKVKKMLDSLNNSGIDVTVYNKKYILLKEECNKNINSSNSLNASIQFMSKASNDLVYQKAISGLKKLQNELNNYDIYVIAYYYPESIDFNEKYSLEQIDDIVIKTIYLLKNIRSNELFSKKIIHKLYNFAYKVIKLELRYKSKSNLLDWVKSDDLAISYINEEITKDIDNIDSKLINAKIASLKAKGLDFNLLDLELISYLVIKNDDNLNNIKSKLYSLLIEINYAAKRLQNSNKLINKWEYLRDYYKVSFGDYAKVVAKTLASTSLIVSLIIGSIKISNIVSLNKPYTKNIVYSETDLVLTPSIDGYQEKVEDYNQVNVIEYGPWEKESEGYVRVINTYDVTDYNYSSLDSYYDMDLNGISSVQEVEETLYLSAEDMYDEVIREVEKITQNPNDLEKDFILFLFSLGFCLGLSAILYACVELFVVIAKDNISWGVIKEDIDNIKEAKENYVKYMEKLNKELQENKKLILSNNEYREKFINLYKKYTLFIQDKKLDKEYQKLVREKNKETSV